MSKVTGGANKGRNGRSRKKAGVGRQVKLD